MISGELIRRHPRLATIAAAGFIAAAAAGCTSPNVDTHASTSVSAAPSRAVPAPLPRPPASPNSAPASDFIKGDGVRLGFIRWPNSGDFPISITPNQGRTVYLYRLSATAPQGQPVGRISDPVEASLECAGNDFIEVSLDISPPTVGNLFIGEGAVSSLWREYSEALHSC